MNRKLTQLRLDLTEVELRIENRREELALLEAERARLRDDVKNALFKDVAGYAPEDTPAPPKRSAYTLGPAGDAAFDVACDKWNRYSKLVAEEWPWFAMDFVEPMSSPVGAS